MFSRFARALPGDCLRTPLSPLPDVSNIPLDFSWKHPIFNDKSRYFLLFSSEKPWIFSFYRLGTGNNEKFVGGCLRTISGESKAPEKFKNRCWTGFLRVLKIRETFEDFPSVIISGCSCFPKNAHSFTRIMTQKGLRNSFPGPLFYVQKFIANPHTPSHPFPHKGNPATQHFQPNNPLNQPKQPQFPSNSPHNFLPIPPSELGLNRALLECSSGNNPHGNPAENPLYPGFPEGI